MKKRIKELAEQAGISLSQKDFSYYWVESAEDIEKFAELIIKECIEQVKPTQHHEVWAQSYLGGVDGLDLLYSKVKEIKKHFGVAE
jgi:hypothetical protein